MLFWIAQFRWKASFATAGVIFTRVNYTFTAFSLSPCWKLSTKLTYPNVNFAFHKLYSKDLLASHSFFHSSRARTESQCVFKSYLSLRPGILNRKKSWIKWFYRLIKEVGENRQINLVSQIDIIDFSWLCRFITGPTLLLYGIKRNSPLTLNKKSLSAFAFPVP